MSHGAVDFVEMGDHRSSLRSGSLTQIVLMKRIRWLIDRIRSAPTYMCMRVRRSAHPVTDWDWSASDQLIPASTHLRR